MLGELPVFRIECCEGQRKCQVFAIAKSGHLQSAYLKMGRCSVCGKFFVVIETTDFSGRKRIVRQNESKAIELFERNRHNILFEIKPIQSGKFGFYLQYGEYGTIKKCYSNLRTLKLGRIAGNFEDIQNDNRFLKSNEFHNFKSTICKKCS